jgi:6,7-dimethyl-8-ribityllumazine synthase
MSKVLIVEARFYNDIADTLWEGAQTVLDAAKIAYDRLAVPGSFELAPAVAMAAQSGTYNGFITLGCIIKGETNHFELVCAESTRAIQNLALEKHLAIGFGLITAYTEEQAWHRAKTDGENYGGRAAIACIRMMELRRQFRLAA